MKIRIDISESVVDAPEMDMGEKEPTLSLYNKEME